MSLDQLFADVMALCEQLTPGTPLRAEIDEAEKRLGGKAGVYKKGLTRDPSEELGERITNDLCSNLITYVMLVQAGEIIPDDLKAEAKESAKNIDRVFNALKQLDNPDLLKAMVEEIGRIASHAHQAGL